jgi:hypothetical protein
MVEDKPENTHPAAGGTGALSPAARRALREAAARRAQAEEKTGGPGRAKEINGPKGEEPTRFGDWERAGRAVDF